MIKLAVLLKRKKGLSFDEFDDYWNDTHGALVVSIDGFTRHVHRYVQSHIVDPGYGGDGMAWKSADFDGIAEVWFESVDEMTAAFAEPKFVELVGHDDRKFVDSDASAFMVTREIDKISPNGEPGVKLAVAIKRRRGMSFEEFDRYWDRTHGDLVTGVPEFTRHVRRYVQSHLIDNEREAVDLHKGWDKASFDGIAELWFDDTAAMIAAFNEPKFVEKIGPDDDLFVDSEETQLFVVREVVKFPPWTVSR